MPIVATELWDGVTIDWEKQRVNESLRCSNFHCRKVLPGVHMKEVDSETGLCRECKEKEKP